MFFYLSKIVFFVIRPSNFVFLLIAAGLVLAFGRFRRIGLVLASAGGLLLGVAGLSPLANLLMVPLEDRFPAPSTLPETVDGILVLGGAIDTVVTGKRPFPGLTTAGERVAVIPGLARRYPQALIVHSGGSGLLFGNSSTEAEGAAQLFESFGLAPDRLVLEDRSLNTWQNAVYTKALVEPRAGQTWLLVTSAMHMPRAVGVFRKAGWTGVVPYPVDWRTRGPEDRLRVFGAVSDGLTRLDIAFREWVGLVAYRASGRTDALLPAP
ncbi:YdcF family protein [Polymorphum gilvum]|uniref:DUF218 protein n=1 Tax=Polymorphum gilvum (strain LMG 25793 / CGMCC 1.9160 / SL003B-26A1) TaxID=991905 RepID=F2IV13_POLGS|nr:YdcF family protein [Polymorphum gilvum]ADZ70242.1 DUF218 protein [Polymorphum gilvum SL003B-26A1]